MIRIFSGVSVMSLLVLGSTNGTELTPASAVGAGLLGGVVSETAPETDRRPRAAADASAEAAASAALPTG
ncbi:MAG: hypothetical protein KY429_00310 [Actinobacteria bacterium]|nr:hypothetical protein [Actinomycetota bacterium]